MPSRLVEMAFPLEIVIEIGAPSLSAEPASATIIPADASGGLEDLRPRYLT
jgi:hypothetical protein